MMGVLSDFLVLNWLFKKQNTFNSGRRDDLVGTNPLFLREEHVKSVNVSLHTGTGGAHP